MKNKQPLKKLFTSGGWTLFVVFVWEMVEEILEEAIAYGITAIFAKALSTLVVIGITQLTKKGLIVSFKPIVKSFTYKEGNDKMTKLRKFFSWIWSNKKSLTGIASGAVMTLSGTGVIDVNALPELPINGFNITPIIYYGVLLVLALIGISGKGFETIQGYAERVAKEKAEKQEKAIIKEAKAELKAEQKLLQEQNPEHIERLARVKYHMSAAGETEFRFKNK